jgi:hypothetical protein
LVFILNKSKNIDRKTRKHPAYLDPLTTLTCVFEKYSYISKKNSDCFSDIYSEAPMTPGDAPPPPPFDVFIQHVADEFVRTNVTQLLWARHHKQHAPKLIGDT